MDTSKESATVKKGTSKARAPRAQVGATRTAAKSARGKPAQKTLAVNPEERWRMVALAAYHKAEKRGFAPGSAEQDWFEAEKEVDVLLGRPTSKDSKRK